MADPGPNAPIVIVGDTLVVKAVVSRGGQLRMLAAIGALVLAAAYGAICVFAPQWLGLGHSKLPLLAALALFAAALLHLYLVATAVRRPTVIFTPQKIRLPDKTVGRQRIASVQLRRDMAPGGGAAIVAEVIDKNGNYMLALVPGGHLSEADCEMVMRHVARWYPAVR